MMNQQEQVVKLESHDMKLIFCLVSIEFKN